MRVFQDLLAGLRALLPDASHPSARQKTPCGVNRWILLVIYMLYAVLTSSVYFGWRSMSAMLLKSGQFSWECTAGEEPAPADAGYLCALQDTKVQSLFTIAMACHFTCSALAGFLLDNVGPKAVALLGQLFNAVAWTLLAFSGPSFRSVYPAFVFMGAGADVSVYPTLLIVSLFPGATAIVMATMGACISTSFFVPLVLRTIWDSTGISFRAVCLGYAVAGPVLCAVLAVVFIPLKAFKGVDNFTACVEAEKLASSDAGGQIHQNCAGTDDLCHQVTNAGESLTGDADEMVSLELPANRDESVNRIKGQRSEKCFAGMSLNELAEDPRFKKHKVSFSSQAFTFLYFGICLYFTVCGWVMAYYQEAAGRFLSKEAEHTLEILTPLSTIPCLILGVIINKVGIMPVILGLNGVGVLTYVCVTGATSIAAQYFSVIFFFVYISIFTTQMYVFVETTFDSAHFGKLIGVASLVGGLLSLVSNVLYGDITVGLLAGNTKPVVVSLIVVQVLMYPVLIAMMTRKKKKAKKEQEEIHHKIMELKDAFEADTP